MNHFQNNLEGPAMMTPEWTVKIAGSYTIPMIETDLGFRLRYDSGRPIFPIESYGPIWASWMGDLRPRTVTYVDVGWDAIMVADDPDDPDWMPSTTILDLSLSKRFSLGEWGGLRSPSTPSTFSTRTRRTGSATLPPTTARSARSCCRGSTGSA